MSSFLFNSTKDNMLTQSMQPDLFPMLSEIPSAKKNSRLGCQTDLTARVDSKLGRPRPSRPGARCRPPRSRAGGDCAPGEALSPARWPHTYRAPAALPPARRPHSSSGAQALHPVSAGGWTLGELGRRTGRTRHRPGPHQ